MKVYLNNDTDYELSNFYDGVKRACAAALQSEGAKAEIGITFVTNSAIKEMNRAYRGVDDVTDVLSFQAGQAPDGAILGDIFICYDKALSQADEIGSTIEKELGFLAVHGTLHIIGYDHSDDAGEKLMIHKQKKILGELA